MPVTDIDIVRLAAGYGLLLIPLGLFLWHRVPLIGTTLISIVRMTVQLLFIGFYLQILFDLNSIWLNIMWLAVMIAVADASILRGCALNFRIFALPVFLALLLGILLPVFIFLSVILYPAPALDARFLVPIFGMVLGNSLRAVIVGLQHFYDALRRREKEYFFFLSAGAGRQEALMPFLKETLQVSMAPTLANMATMGLVALPGMMTGVMIGGISPAAAIKYQIAIMIAILSGTSLAVTLAVYFSLRKSLTPWGSLNRSVFTRLNQ